MSFILLHIRVVKDTNNNLNIPDFQVFNFFQVHLLVQLWDSI